MRYSSRLFATAMIACIAIALIRCGSGHASLQPAFYHWKAHPDLGPNAFALADSLGADRLYLRLFDIDLEEGTPVPVGILQRFPDLPSYWEVTPVVFITTRSLRSLDVSGIDSLALRTFRLIRGMLPPEKALGEWQFDCDWTPGTREAYFAFLEKMGELHTGTLSSTLRLHQLRRPRQTGVPPTDRACLMYYNMGEVTNPNEPNSILNLEVGKNYLNGSRPYPLPLDLALPLFGWGVVFRDSAFLHLIDGLKPEMLADTSRFKIQEPNLYTVIKSTYLQGYYLYKGDRIRLESAEPDNLLKAAEQLRSSQLFDDSRYLVFYHLEEGLYQDYPHEVLQRILQYFRDPDGR